MMLPMTAMPSAPPTSRDRSFMAEATPCYSWGSAEEMALVARAIAAPMPAPSTSNDGPLRAGARRVRTPRPQQPNRLPAHWPGLHALHLEDRADRHHDRRRPLDRDRPHHPALPRRQHRTRRSAARSPHPPGLIAIVGTLPPGQE